MWAKNVLWPNNGKLRKARKKWRVKALTIDTRKTRLVIEGADAKSKNVQPLIRSELAKPEEEGFDPEFHGC